MDAGSEAGADDGLLTVVERMLGEGPGLWRSKRVALQSSSEMAMVEGGSLQSFASTGNLQEAGELPHICEVSHRACVPGPSVRRCVHGACSHGQILGYCATESMVNLAATRVAAGLMAATLGAACKTQPLMKQQCFSLECRSTRGCFLHPAHLSSLASCICWARGWTGSQQCCWQGQMAAMQTLR